MRQQCPQCHIALKLKQGRRYLPGSYRAINPTVVTVLDKWRCNKRGGCQHEFIIRTDYPLDPSLSPTIRLSYEFSLWQRAHKTKPGAAQMHTTASEYTELISKDPASEYVRTRILLFQPQNGSLATA